MKFETLGNNKKILLATVIVFVVILTLIIRTSLAKYKVTESINIVSGRVNYSPSDFSLIGIYLEGDNGYTQSDTIPESGYQLNNEESYCKVGDTVQDVTINYDFENQALSITPLTSKGLKCYLYFDEIKGQTVEDILATKTISTRTDFSTVLTTDTTGTIYSAKDDDGTSYYFAGAPTDNWVKFAGLYWRIIRINGDGTIRLIYNGTSTTTTGTGTSITKCYFNSKVNDNAYVGFMYGTAGASTYEATHKNTNTSTAKMWLDDWYSSNMASYKEILDENAGFCGDRTPSTDDSSITANGLGGTGTKYTVYGDYLRYWNGGNPTLKCTNINDLYTVKSSSKGNKSLTNPIGLINMNEVWLAGGSSNPNKNYYLNNGDFYWTMSPESFVGKSTAYVFSISSDGSLNAIDVDSKYGLRPVINIRSDVTITGLGTIASPYEVTLSS